MPGLLATISNRNKKLREAAGLSPKAQAKKSTESLSKQFPAEHKKYLLDPKSDDISFKEYLKRKG